MPIHRVFLSGWIDGENEEKAVTFFNEIVARGCGLNGLTRNSQGGSMKKRAVFLAAGIVLLWTVSGFSQVRAAQNRIPQSVVINGQTVNGAYVTAPGGQLQRFTCPAPQHYIASDGASPGCACCGYPTGLWHLHDH